MRYCAFLMVNRLQKYKRSKLEVDKNLPVQLGPGMLDSNQAESATFFLTSHFDLKYFCSLLQELNFMSTWSQKPKASAWLLIYILCWFKAPLFHIIQRVLSKQKWQALYLSGQYLPFRDFLWNGMIRSEQKKTDMSKSWPLIKNPYETWWKYSTHEAIIFTKFHKDWRKIVDFLFMAKFLTCPSFFCSDFSNMASFKNMCFPMF